MSNFVIDFFRSLLGLPRRLFDKLAACRTWVSVDRAIPVRIPGSPFPIAPKDGREFGIFRPPAEDAARFFSIGHEPGRIAGSRRLELDRDRLLCHLPRGFDDFHY